MTELQRIANDRAGAQTIFTVADSPLIQRLKQEASELEHRRPSSSKTYKEKHPEILKIDAQIEQVNQRIEAEIQDDAAGGADRVPRWPRPARRRCSATSTGCAREAQELNEKEIQYLESAAGGRLQPAALRGGAQAAQGDRRDRRARDQQREHRRGRHRAAGADPAAQGVNLLHQRSWSGLLVGVGTALTIEYFDTTVKTPDDVERYLGLPVIGIVPQFVGEAISHGRARQARRHRTLLRA